MDSVILGNVRCYTCSYLTHILNVDITNDSEELNIIRHSHYFVQEKLPQNILLTICNSLILSQLN